MDCTLYFLGLLFRNAAKALSFLLLVKINHRVSIWNLFQKYKPQKLKKKKKNIDEYIVDEIVVKAGSELIMLWVAIIEPKYREILSINL
jgi:putative transposase